MRSDVGPVAHPTIRGCVSCALPSLRRSSLRYILLGVRCYVCRALFVPARGRFASDRHDSRAHARDVETRGMRVCAVGDQRTIGCRNALTIVGHVGTVPWTTVTERRVLITVWLTHGPVAVVSLSGVCATRLGPRRARLAAIATWFCCPSVRFQTLLILVACVCPAPSLEGGSGHVVN
eukprot:1170872-Prymnesium_polylepis.2